MLFRSNAALEKENKQLREELYRKNFEISQMTKHLTDERRRTAQVINDFKQHFDLANSKLVSFKETIQQGVARRNQLEQELEAARSALGAHAVTGPPHEANEANEDNGAQVEDNLEGPPPLEKRNWADDEEF